MTIPEFLTSEDVQLLHREQLDRYGGAAGIRDAGSFESAVAMPQASFGDAWLHADLYAQAAAYAFHIAQNQSLVDGNKRAGLAAALVFLDINGKRILDPDGLLYTAMIDLAERRLNKEGLALLLRVLDHRAHGARRPARRAQTHRQSPQRAAGKPAGWVLLLPRDLRAEPRSRMGRR